MTVRTWLNRDVVGIGEAIVEFAPFGENIYRRSFAGDTSQLDIDADPTVGRANQTFRARAPRAGP
jgi:hypothetical protein